jgi:hypothetical protein
MAPLIECCQGHDTQGETLGAPFLQSSDDAFDPVQMIDDPIGISERTDRDRRGSGREESMRSASIVCFDASASINPFHLPAERSSRPHPLSRGG